MFMLLSYKITQFGEPINKRVDGVLVSRAEGAVLLP